MAKLNKIITIACLLVCVFIGNGSATTDLDTDRDGKVDLIYIPDLSSIYQTIMGDDDNYLTDAQLAALLAIDTWAEIEAGIALQNISGAVTDSQVPNNITIDLATSATTATTANAGDSATAFFASGTIEDERLPPGLTRDTEAALAYEPIKGEDDNFVTDAEKTIIGNTSGANTGDQAAADVDITDADENFTATEVETALDELYDTKEPSLTVASQAEMEAGTVTALRSMSPLRVAQAIAAQADTSTMTVTAHGVVSSGTETFTPGVSTVTVAGAFTWAFGSWPASGTEGTIRAYITNGGAAVITGWSEIIWEGGVEPTLQASGLDVLIFTTLDGGTTVYGFVAGEDMQ